MYKQINEGHFLDPSQSSGCHTQTLLQVTSKTDHIQILLWAFWTANLAAYIVDRRMVGFSVVVVYMMIEQWAAQPGQKHAQVKYKYKVTQKQSTSKHASWEDMIRKHICCHNTTRQAMNWFTAIQWLCWFSNNMMYTWQEIRISK